MSLFKKLLALTLVLLMSIGLVGCADLSWVIKTDKITVPSGVYIYYQTQGYLDAVYSLAEENQAYYEYHVNGYSLLNETLDDKPVSEHVNQYAMDMSKQYIVVNTLFDELGLTLTEEDEKAISKEVLTIWRSTQAYLEAIGVDQEALKAVVTSSVKESKVFDAYYEIGGIMGTTEEMVNAYIDDEYARIKLIEFNFADSAEDAIDAERKETMLMLAQIYLQRANNGEDFDALIAEITEKFGVSNVDGEQTEEKTETEYPNEFIIDTETAVPSQKFVKYVFSKCKVGEYTLIQDDISFYLVQRLSLSEREDIMAESQSLIIAELFDSQYTSLINSTLKGYTIETNDKAVKKHTAENAVMGTGN